MIIAIIIIGYSGFVGVLEKHIRMQMSKKTKKLEDREFYLKAQHADLRRSRVGRLIPLPY
jgi:hypothetical protein